MDFYRWALLIHLLSGDVLFLLQVFMCSVIFESLMWCLALFRVLGIPKDGTVCVSKEFTHILGGEIDIKKI